MEMLCSSRRLLSLGSVALVFALAACGGGGGGSNSLVPSGPQSIISQNNGVLDFTGTIDEVGTNSFHLEVGVGAGNNWVATNSSTVFVGAQPYVGENVEVNGTGSFAVAHSIVATKVTQLNAAPTPTPAAPSPAPTITPVPPAPVPVQSSAPQSVIPIPAGVQTYGGNIVQLYSTGFSFYAGRNYGNMHQNNQSNTTTIGGTAAVGLYATVVGPSKPGYWVNGTLVTLTSSAPGSASVSGTVTAQTPYGFTVSTASGTLPVGMTSATIVGGAPLTVGSTVTVNGTGSPTTSIVAIQIVVAQPTPPPGAVATPTPGPIAMTHVPTADYLAGLYGTTSVSPTQAAPYLTWAQTDIPGSVAMHAAGIKTQLYSDPNRVYTTDPLYPYVYQTESNYAHDCSGNRITFFSTANRFVMDPNSPTLQAAFAKFVADHQVNGHFDMVWEDNAGPLGPDTAFASFTPSLPCNYSDATWISGGIALNQAPSTPIMVNGLNIPNGNNVSETLQLLSSSNTVGGNFEGCYSDVNRLKQTDSTWQITENEELQTLAQGKLFECMLRNQGAASSNADARIYGYASYLLTYDPQNSIFWEEYQTTSGFHVEPESQLVPMDPVVSTPSSISGLQVGLNPVYGREYQHCYIAGQFVSACAVAVNADGNYSHPFPFPQYTHTLVLNGGGILDGGTMSTNGGAPPQMLGPGEAAIVFP